MHNVTSLWFEWALLPQGWAAGVRLTASNGRIEQVTVDVEAAQTDERHAVGIPGLPNVHSHAFQRGLAGLTERRGPAGDNFWTWRELMYQFVERIDPDEMEAIASLAYAQMLESGFTQVGEFHYLHHDRGGVPFADPGELAVRIAAAAADTGIGLTILPTLYAHSGFGGAQPVKRQRRFVNDRDGFADIVAASRRAVKDLPGAVVGVAPHSLRAVTPEELSWLVDFARDSVIHIHVAEQTKEVDDCIAWSGRRPVQWLLEHAQVDSSWCLVHSTHIEDAELQAIVATGAVVGLCPITESNLGDGIFPARAYLSRGGRVGIGSDSNIVLDAAAELRTLEYSQRLARRERNVLAPAAGCSTGRALYDAALAGGAQILRSSSGLVPGAWLDLVSLKTDDPDLAQRRQDEILDSWIFCGGRRLTDCVWRAGEKVVTDGRHRQRDVIEARYRRALKSLLA
jgi:formimidoylglutamate deiminase